MGIIPIISLSYIFLLKKPSLFARVGRGLTPVRGHPVCGMQHQAQGRGVGNTPFTRNSKIPWIWEGSETGSQKDPDTCIWMQ